MDEGWGYDEVVRSHASSPALRVRKGAGDPILEPREMDKEIISTIQQQRAANGAGKGRGGGARGAGGAGVASAGAKTVFGSDDEGEGGDGGDGGGGGTSGGASGGVRLNAEDEDDFGVDEDGEEDAAKTERKGVRVGWGLACDAYMRVHVSIEEWLCDQH